MICNSLKSQAKVAGGAIITSLFILAATALMAVMSLGDYIDDLAVGFEQESKIVLPLVQVTENIRFDVAQVQQWLTDISATRGRDGLNDGFDEAAGYAEAFNQDMAKAYELVDLMAADPLLVSEAKPMREALDHARDAFPGYYDMGREMAQAYIDHGPAEGNKLMGSFDTHAAQINDGIAEIRNAIQVFVNHEVDKVGQTSLASQSTVTSNTTIIIIVGIVATMLALFIAYRQNVTVTQIGRATDVINRAAAGDMNHRIVHVDKKGEIADLHNNVNTLLDQVDIFLNEAGGTMKHVANGQYYRKIDQVGLLGSFSLYAGQINDAVDVLVNKNDAFINEATTMGDRLSTVASTLKTTAEQLQVSSSELGTVAVSTSEQSETVSTSAHDASSNVQSVASATEEFSASIAEISTQVSHSAKMSEDAVVRVREADTKVSGLSNAANKIGEVLALITDIADQTNLLALNATIEAARAGDAGKGFAVVASEVKNLANQTAKATEEISSQINGMQSATDDVINAIKEIGSAIEQIETVGSTISGTVGEQKDVVTEVSRSAQGAVSQVAVVADSIQSVSQGAENTAASVSQIGEAATGLTDMSVEILRDVENFVERVKSI